jgi:site-specific DNA recombinase
VSGAIPFEQRPEGRRLLADAQAGRIGTVLAYKLDRIGRDTLDVLLVRRQLEYAGCRLRFVHETFDDTPTGRFQLGVSAGVAQLERETILLRIQDGKARRLAAGGWMGGPAPFGYVLVGKDATAHLVVDEAAAAGVRRQFALLLDERIGGVHAIACRLNRDGVPTATGKLGGWRANTVYKVLTNPVYAGWLKVGDQIVPGAHEAIIPPAVFDAARRALERHTFRTRRQTGRPYLLRGLIRCGHCGCLYRGTTSVGRTGTVYPAYRCNGQQAASTRAGTSHPTAEQRCTGSISLPTAWLEGEIWWDVERYVRAPEDTLALLAARMQGTEDQQDALRADLAACQQQQDALQGERDAILALFRKGRISERDLGHQLDALDEEGRTIAANIRRKQEQMAGARDVADKLAGARTLLERLGRLADWDDPAVRRRLVEGLVSSIMVTSEPAGTSRRGKPKRAPVVTVTYCFADPSDPPSQHGCSTMAVLRHA